MKFGINQAEFAHLGFSKLNTGAEK